VGLIVYQHPELPKRRGCFLLVIVRKYSSSLSILQEPPLREANLTFSISSPPASPVRLALPVRHRLRVRRLPGWLGRRAGLRESNPPAARCEALRAGGGQAEIENANKNPTNPVNPV